MIIKVDQNLCLGCGLCVSLCPEFFELSEDGKAKVKNDLEDSLIKDSNIEEVIESCPAEAISILGD